MRGCGSARYDVLGDVVVGVHQHLLRSVAEPDGDQLIAHAVEYPCSHPILNCLAAGQATHVDRNAFKAILRLSGEAQRDQKA